MFLSRKVWIGKVVRVPAVKMKWRGGGVGVGLCLEQDIITLKKATSNNIQGLFQGFTTLIINIEGKYGFLCIFGIKPS